MNFSLKSTVSERAVMRPNRAHEGRLTSVILGKSSDLVLGSIGLMVLLNLNGPLKRSCAKATPFVRAKLWQFLPSQRYTSAPKSTTYALKEEQQKINDCNSSKKHLRRLHQIIKIGGGVGAFSFSPANLRPRVYAQLH